MSVTVKPAAAEDRPFSLPAGATEVFLVRHGSFEPAPPGIPFPLTDGRSDPELSETGLAQAEAIAARLAPEGVAALFVTPLRRTQQTAVPLAEATGLEPIVLDDLAEVRLGEWEGGEFLRRVAQGDPVARRAFELERWDVIPGAEPFESLSSRVRAGVERIVEETGPDAIAAAIVHGAVIGELCRQATRSSPFAFVHADTGSVTRLVVHANGRWLLRSFNEISHLPARTKAAA